MFSDSEIKKLREDFPILQRQYNDCDLVYFDNGATSQRPEQVVAEVANFWRKYNANVHRGIHFLAEEADEAYVQARKTVATFVGAASTQEIVFTRNATEALNIVAYAYALNNLTVGDEILTTKLEHHSNIVPWQMIAERTGSRVVFVDLESDGTIDMADFEQKISEKTKLVTVGHISNVLGTVNGIDFVIEKAKEVGAKTVIDGCQAVPHVKINLQELDCDFYAFSGHKMCAPMGIGVLYGKKELLAEMEPFLGGGSMISSVTTDGFVAARLPEKYDAGTPNVNGAIGLAAAINYLEEIGLEKIEAYEQTLSQYLFGKLNELNFVKVFGPQEDPKRLAIASFTMDGVHPHDIAEFLTSRAICVRAGHHCAQPLMDFFNVPATARASLYFYNERAEIDRFVTALSDCYKFFN